jgi:ATP-dependent Clp protease ATP-binding subunit ClpA
VFERYTEKARRCIFFARYEASQTGSSYIEPGHLLLGLLREDTQFAANVLKLGLPDVEELRRQLLEPGAEKSSTSVDLPLSHSSKRALAYGAEESERLTQAHIGTGHLAIGLLREDDAIAARLLKSRGADLETLRSAAAAQPPIATESESAKSMAQLQQLMSRHDSDFSRVGDLREGRFSATYTKDGVRTVRSHNYVHGHEVRVIEHIQLSEDGKSLRYSIEIQGLGQEHRHEIDFPLPEGTA